MKIFLFFAGTRQRRQLAPPSQPSQPPASQTARPDQWRQSCRAGREAERVSCSAGEPQLRSRLARPGKWRGGSFKLTNWREILSMIWGLFLGRCWNAVPIFQESLFRPYKLNPRVLYCRIVCGTENSLENSNRKSLKFPKLQNDSFSFPNPQEEKFVGLISTLMFNWFMVA